MAIRSVPFTPFTPSTPSTPVPATTPGTPAFAGPGSMPTRSTGARGVEPSPVASPERSPGAAPLLTATVTDGALVLATLDGDVAVRVPLAEVAHPPGPVAWDRTPPDVAHVCTLDTALARRLYRRVSAWHLDAQGRLSARVRPTA